MYDSIEPGRQVVAILGEPAARKLLDVLTLSRQERAEAIERLLDRDTMALLVEALIDLEAGVLTRVQLVESLQRVLGVTTDQGVLTDLTDPRRLADAVGIHAEGVDSQVTNPQPAWAFGPRPAAL